jgi:predicted O-methyltransferase YrrM
MAIKRNKYGEVRRRHRVYVALVLGSLLSLPAIVVFGWLALPMTIVVTGVLFLAMEVSQLTRQIARETGTLALAGQSGAWFDRMLQPRVPLPPFGRWALGPEMAGLLVHRVLDREPKLVVEFGSGISTVVMALALRRNGGGRIVSLEHDRRFVDSTREMLITHGVDDIAEVVHAPISDVEIDGRRTRWYDTTALERLGNDPVELVLVDGPPSSVAPLARQPAVPALAGRLAPDAEIYLDDAERQDERRTLDHWAKALGASYRILPFGKCPVGVLRLGT